MRAREVVAVGGFAFVLGVTAWAAFEFGKVTHPHKPKPCSAVVVIDGRLMVRHCPSIQGETDD